MNSKILYDDTCVMCNSVIRFILKAAKNKNIEFLPLNSDEAIHIAQYRSLPDSIIFLQGKDIFSESEAVIHILKYMGFPYKLLCIFRLIPISYRNKIYRYIAKRRYLIFGKTESCPLPPRT